MFGQRKHRLQWQKHSSEHLHGYLSRTGIVTWACTADQGYQNSNLDYGNSNNEQQGVTDHYQVKSLVPLDLGPQKSDMQSRKQPRRCLIPSHVWTPDSPCCLKVWMISADLGIKIMCTAPGEHLNISKKKTAPSPCVLYCMKFSFLTKFTNSNHHLFSFWQELSSHRMAWLTGKKKITLYLCYWTCAAIKPVRQELYGQRRE